MKKITAALTCLTVISCSASKPGSCSTEEAIAARREKHPYHEETWFQSELTNDPYVVSEYTIGYGMADRFPESYRKPAELIVSGTIAEVESYGFRDDILSDVILRIDDVLKNETSFPVDDEIYFTTAQGILPYYGELLEKYKQDGRNPVWITVKSGDALYRNGMSGVFLLNYDEHRDGFIENRDTNTSFLKTSGGQYVTSADYSKYVKGKYIYDDPQEDHEAGVEFPEECFLSLDDIKELSGIEDW